MSLRIDWSAFDAGTGDEPVSALEAPLRAASADLVGTPIDEIFAALDAFGAALLDRNHPLIARYRGSGLPFLARLCAADGLRAMVGDALGDLACLDGFQPRPYDDARDARAFPRGVTVHWLAGNVPTLGVLSLISAIATKNASIVRVPSAAGAMLSDLMAMMDAMGGLHARLARAVVVARYDREDEATAAAVSMMADARMIWGGDETTAVIRALPAKPACVDIVFPDRTSFVIVGRDQYSGDNAPRIARLIAHDVSVFEQKACASPHTVFLADASDAERDAFAAALADAMIAELQRLPKQTPAPREASAILNLRSQYAMFHKSAHSKGLEYTILMDDDEKLGPPIGNRTVFLRKLPMDETLRAIIPANVQTVGLAADGEERERLSNLLGAAGVHRIAPLGAMTHFEVPWDGFAIPQFLVRWTTRPRVNAAAAA